MWRVIYEEPVERVARHFYDNWGEIISKLAPADLFDVDVIEQNVDTKVYKTCLTAKGPFQAREFHYSLIFYEINSDKTYCIKGCSVETGRVQKPNHCMADVDFMMVIERINN